MVNSLHMAFTSPNPAGDLSIALLATDRTDVVVPEPTVIGLWEFDTSGGFSFGGSGSVVLTFRYDDAKAASLSITESDLKVWQETTPGTWEDITDSINTIDHTITTTAVTDFTHFAVSKENPVPPKGTIILVQ